MSSARAEQTHSTTPFVRLANGWLQYTDETSQAPYYYNKASGETRWSFPPEATQSHGGVIHNQHGDEAARGVTAINLNATSAAGSSSRQSNGKAQSFGAACGDMEMASSDTPQTTMDGYVSAAKAAAAAASDVAAAANHEARPPAAVDMAWAAQKRSARRLKVLEEVLESERAYVKALQKLEKVYMTPLRMVADQPKGAIFSHADLDAIFLNIDVIIKINSNFLRELEAEHALSLADGRAVRYGPIIFKAAKQFRGCYTRYVNNYDQAERHLNSLKTEDKEKHRYLEVCRSHPECKQQPGDKIGLDVRSFLIRPVQRVPRYRLLLQDLLNCTEAGHADEAPLQEALSKVEEVARHINEEKREHEQFEAVRRVQARLQPPEPNLVRLDRALLREGELTKVRHNRRQKRQLFLFNDLLLYCVSTGSGDSFKVKGRIPLGADVRVQWFESRAGLSFGFEMTDATGKGYTWFGESETHTRKWCEAIQTALDSRGTTAVSAMPPSEVDDSIDKPDDI